MESATESSESLKDRILNKILRINEDDDHHDQDICRVCRLAGEDTLYHPCLCTGSIKYVHQECLMQWLKYSKKEVCELCNHKFSFRPLYRDDMPDRLPIKELFNGMFAMAVRFLRYFLVCCIVATCWLGFVPLMASRIYRLVFSGLLSFFSPKILSLFYLENVVADIGTGLVIVAIFTCTLFSFIWLRDQIMVGAPPAFLHLQEDRENRRNGQNQDDVAHVEFRDQVNEHRPNPPPEPQQQPAQQQQQQVDDGHPPLLAEEPNLDNAEAELAAPNVAAVVPPPPPAADEPADVAGGAVAVEENENGPRNANNADNDDADHLAEDFTWQRILGLDGSTAFIDAVFYVIAMNLVFDVLFLHWPAEVGMALFHTLGYSGKIIYFSMPIYVLSGYAVVFVVNYFVHEVARYFRYGQLYTLSAIFHLMVKVFLLFVVEILFFPVMCGWWLDICSLPLTGVTLDSRLTMFRSYPFASTFLHWMVGMIYVFYSASFILVLRELLRPGVLWFIRNLNDPEFNPILEMIQQSVFRHGRRLVASTMLFFTIILLVVYIPLRLILWVSPRTLPYVLTASADTSMGEVSVELVLLQLVLPTVLEYSKAFSILKKLVQWWCRIVGGWLKLDSYLLPRRANAEEEQDPARRLDNAQRVLQAADQLIRAVNILQQRQEGVAEQPANPEEPVDEEEEAEIFENRDSQLQRVDKSGNANEAKSVGLNAIDDEGFGAEEDEESAAVIGRNFAFPIASTSSSATPVMSTSQEADESQKSPNQIDENTPSTSAAGATATSNASNDLSKSIRSESAQQTPAPAAENPDEAPLNGMEAEGVQQIADEVQDEHAHLLHRVAQRERQENHLGARHQALLMIRDNVHFEEYERPDMFTARIVALLVCLALTAILMSFLFFLVPVSIGRLLFAALSKIDNGSASTAKSGTVAPTHELYTLAAGLYFCWVVSKVWMVVYEWCQKGWNYVCKIFRSTAWLAARLLVAMIPMFIIIPFMLGLFFQLLVVAPLRVTMNQTPLFFPWKEWAIGVLHFKIFCASVLMGPDWWLKTAFERIYAGGVRGFELRYLFTNLALPLFHFISLQISLPYVGAKIVLFFFNLSDEDKVIYTRFAYPFSLMCVTTIAFLFWQWQKLKSLAQKIRNDKYLIGTQLVNFYRENAPGAAIEATASVSAPAI